MKLEKADYGTIIQFGNMQDFNLKLLQEGKTLSEVIDIKDKASMSLLEKSLVAKKCCRYICKAFKGKKRYWCRFCRWKYRNLHLLGN